jgi:hypothetical protein
MSFFDFTKPPIKEEGSSVTDSYKYKATNRYPPYPAPLTIQKDGKIINAGELLLQLEYILQRTVPDYDELVNQFNAIRDIERCSNEQG